MTDPALGTADAGILVDLDDPPAAVLGNFPKLTDLVFDISRDPHIGRGSPGARSQGSLPVSECNAQGAAFGWQRQPHAC